jgi:uncharacterized protein YjbJ (UPF0337 family)
MNKEKIEGKFDQVSGKIKESVGKAVGDDRMVSSGLADQAKGAVKETWGNVKDSAASARDDVRANAHVHGEDLKHRASDAAHTMGEKIAATAQNVRDAVNEKLDEGKRRDRF